MILQTIECDVEGCESTYTEPNENAGFPGWGHVKGIMEEKDGYIRETAYLCPGCLNKIKNILNGGFHDLG